jgi:hypothetical protein
MAPTATRVARVTVAFIFLISLFLLIFEVFSADFDG